MGGPVGHRDPGASPRGSPQRARARRAGAALAHEPRAPGAARRARSALLAGALAKLARDVDAARPDEVARGARGRAAAARRRWRTSATRSPRSRCSRAPSACPASSRRCSPAMEQEHERAAGAWQAEWGTLTDLLRLTGSAAAWGARPARAPGGRRRDAREPRRDARPRRGVGADRPRAGGAPRVIPSPREPPATAPTAVLLGQLARHDAAHVGRAGARSPSASASSATTTRGHGASPAPPGPYEIADLGGDVLDAARPPRHRARALRAGCRSAA